MSPKNSNWSAVECKGAVVFSSSSKMERLSAAELISKLKTKFNDEDDMDDALTVLQSKETKVYFKFGA